MISLKRLHEEQGASSILVIVLMVVLLVFGLAVLTTSLSNVRLGERKKAWLGEYYQLEGLGAEAVANYDTLLLSAETEARTYIANGSYQDDYLIDEPLTDLMRQRLYALIYSDIAAEKISDAIAGNDQAVFYRNSTDVDAVLAGSKQPESRLEFTVTLPESNYKKHLQITMKILCPTEENLTDDLKILHRYVITRHTQEQEAFEFDESTEFDDPFEEEEINGNPFGE